MLWLKLLWTFGGVYMKWLGLAYAVSLVFGYGSSLPVLHGCMLNVIHFCVLALFFPSVLYRGGRRLCLLSS